MVMRTQQPARRESLHGPPGWTRESGVTALLRPHLDHRAPGGTSFARFEGVGGDVARDLLGLLPEGNLSERQNGGPSCQDVLRAAARWTGEVELSGYLVSPPRWDERVSVDGMVVHSGVLREQGAVDEAVEGAAGLLPVVGGPSAALTRHGLWEELRRSLGLGDSTQDPDELIPFLPEGRGGRLSWWLWWD